MQTRLRCYGVKRYLYSLLKLAHIVSLEILIVASSANEGNVVTEKVGFEVNTVWHKHSQIHYKNVMKENYNYFTQYRKGNMECTTNKEPLSILEGFLD